MKLPTCRALASVSPGLAMAARMAVVVVPIFEPRDNGYALSMLMTPIPIQTNRILVKIHFHTLMLSSYHGLYNSCFVCLIHIIYH